MSGTTLACNHALLRALTLARVGNNAPSRPRTRASKRRRHAHAAGHAGEHAAQAARRPRHDFSFFPFARRALL